MLHYHGGGGLRLCQQPVAPMALGVRNSSLAELKLEDVFFAPVATAVGAPIAVPCWGPIGRSMGILMEVPGVVGHPALFLLCAGS